ncbi:alpha/beta hydrolase [Elusimicrobiota bacterium]
MHKQPIKARAFFWKGMYIFELLPTSARAAKGMFICLHGFPAWSTKNYDIAEYLCLLGYAVLIPHYHGLGFSKGEFSFKQSAQRADHFIRYVKKYYKMPVSLMGHSWGGYLAIALCHHIEKNLLLFAPLSRFPAGRSLSQLIKGLFLEAPDDCRRYTTATMRKELESLARSTSYEKFFTKMANKRLLIVHGKNDNVIPIEDSRALVAKLKVSSDILELDDDHLLLQRRRDIFKFLSQWFLRK